MADYRVHMTKYDALTRSTVAREVVVQRATHVGDAINQASRQALELWGPGWIISDGGCRHARWTSEEEELVLDSLESAIRSIAGALSQINPALMPENKLMDAHLKSLGDTLISLRKVRDWYGRGF